MDLGATQVDGRISQDFVGCCTRLERLSLAVRSSVFSRWSKQVSVAGSGLGKHQCFINVWCKNAAEESRVRFLPEGENLSELLKVNGKFFSKLTSLDAAASGK